MGHLSIDILQARIAAFKGQFPEPVYTIMLMREENRQNILDLVPMKEFRDEGSPLNTLSRFMGIEIVSFHLVPANLALPFKDYKEAKDFMEYAEAAHKYGANTETIVNLWKYKKEQGNLWDRKGPDDLRRAF